MPPKSTLTVESLIELLEKQRCTFTDQYCPLLTAQETALRKANVIIAKDLGSLTRNFAQKKAHSIWNDIKNCISCDVYVLCTLATSLSILGASKLEDYVPKITIWWMGVDHPKGLTEVSARYVIGASKLIPTGNLGTNNLLFSESPTPRSTTSPLSSAQNANGFEPEGSANSQPLQVPIRIAGERSSKRPRLESPQFPSGPVLPGKGQYCSFSFMRRHMIENLPEPFRSSMQNSNLWGEEKDRGGLAITNCLSMYLPETGGEDALFVVRVGYHDGFNICNLFGLGDPDNPVSEEDSVEEARD